MPLVVSEREGAKAREEFDSHPSVEPVRGQMLCLQQPSSHAPFARHVVYSPRGYIVPRRDGRLLAGSTSERAGFDAAVTAGGVHSIASHAFEIAPRVASLQLLDSWAGLRPRAADDRPVLGGVGVGAVDGLGLEAGDEGARRAGWPAGMFAGLVGQ